ncbi:SDR family NAD(P)-dependent oxidoreductase [Spirosoma flavum]|uniref:SDR family NAD(P)-dependent oxidoreductase n=1 Tax=Spirosoma flavum TaxID=2048557 RepID=A0ABW6AQL9_9BACT
MAQEGVNVLLNGRSKERVEAIAMARQLMNELPGTQFRGIAADFSKVEDINALLTELPQVDILINNVVIFEPKEFTEIPDVNSVPCSSGALPHYAREYFGVNWF